MSIMCIVGMPRHSKPSIAVDIQTDTLPEPEPSHQLSLPPPPASWHKQHIHTHTHELSSSLLLADDEDEHSLPGSSDNAQCELHQSHSIVCATILSWETYELPTS